MLVRSPHPSPRPEGEGAAALMRRPLPEGERVAGSRARSVRLLCVDVDGVLTDAGMYYGPDGEVLKKFNTRDGMGLARVREAGVAVAIISGEDSPIVHARAAKLKIDDVFTGVADKLEIVRSLCVRHKLDLQAVAYVGDDLNDLAAMQNVGLA